MDTTNTEHDHRTATPLPVWGSDGFRHEKCTQCGDRIGYARFHARRQYNSPTIALDHDRCLGKETTR